AHGTFDAELVVVAGGQARTGLERAGRLPGDDVDGAANRVASVERPLRAPQDFDTLYVQKIHEHHRGACQVHTVEVNRGAGIGTSGDAGRSDTAVGPLRPAAVRRNRERRHETGEAFDSL